MYQDPSIITLVGFQPGPTVTIMSGVHGEEVCGVIALRRAIQEIKPMRGKVHFIFANLPAIALNVRQTQMNLNRAFRPAEMLQPEELETYERRRAEELMPYLDESEALLDIHSSITESSIPFVICEPHSFRIVRHLPFSIRSHGWDAIEPGGTDYYVNRNQLHGAGICVECGYHLDLEAPRRAYESIQIFLAVMGIIEGYPLLPEHPQREIFARFIYHTKIDFRPSKNFADFEPVREGDLLGYDGEEEVRAGFSGAVIFVRVRTEPKKEAFILAEE